MKICAYTALLYGKSYLGFAIRSIIDYVEEYHVIYSPVGAHGSRTDIPCPDTRDELYDIAQRAAGFKLRWHDGMWLYEGAQRDSIHQYAPNADVILVLDSDELWPYGDQLPTVIQAGKIAGVRRVRLPMVHFWKSFHQAILHDPAYPERIIYPGLPEGSATLGNVPPIAHMGYAIQSELCAYKWRIHGHLGEYRKDCDWFRDRYMNPDAKTDLHPVGSEYWTWEKVDPLQYMPSFMSEHPYFKLDVIP